MNDIALFYLLKEKILVKYREHYPYYTGTIHSFGNKDIAQLIDLIEKDCNERVSEKWVYTHLKPTENEKLPRKDMLDIFCKWTGYSNWDAYVFHHKDEHAQVMKAQKPEVQKRNTKITYMVMGIAAVIFGSAIVLTASGGDVTICLRDRYTQKEVEEGKVTLYVLDNGKKEKLTHKDGCFVIKEHKGEKLVVAESPYYKADTLKIAAGTTQYEFDLQPDDYAMMMRAYMNNNADDWKKRRRQLDAVISDDAVIVEVMFDDIGVEFLNKEEFINKMTTPSKIARAMEIVEIEYSGKKIVSLKYMQKEK
ncbi:hypothetical protein OGH69_08645 [Flavobacterium sp. MFBS3-15]|uniref:hypothetical protein n=1 Tax=Flavobacterium sp. MFBS3-15 TaxID=2989816 RepID=UPI002235439F|nr:hypothetical protein [Flavobacterium sp. MFBS3-15]MCW4469029.1 hypothetical protein [Flavobacterium sp. MFBS3-15]